MQRVALVAEPVQGRENEHLTRSAVRKIGIDPHFAFANMLADVAWARAYGTSRMLVVSESRVKTDEEPKVSPYRQQIENAMPALSHTPDRSLNCGSCANRDPISSTCTAPGRSGWRVEPDQPSCPFYLVDLDLPDEDDD
jgi:hypothetical protein